MKWAGFYKIKSSTEHYDLPVAMILKSGPIFAQQHSGIKASRVGPVFQLLL